MLENLTTDSQLEKYVYPLGIVMCLLIAIINVLMIVVFATKKNLRDHVSGIVLSLTVADFLVGLANGVRNATALFVPDSDLATFVICFISDSFIISSVLHLCLIALDRFISVLIPLRYPALVTREVLNVGIISAWVLSFIFGLLSQRIYIPYFLQDDYFGQKLQVFLYMMAASFLFAVYGHMACIALKHRRQVQAQMPKHLKTCHNRKTTKVLMTVVGTCLLLWLPYTALAFCTLILKEESKAPPCLEPIFLFVGLTNHGINVFIYSLMKKDFKEACFDLFKCSKKSINPTGCSEQKMGTFHK